MMRSAVQHFAAGVVFAAAAGEILPDVKNSGAVVPLVIGGAIGIVLVLSIRKAEASVSGVAGFLAVITLDLLIDGLVLGLAFHAGQKAGILLAVALTIEVLFLGVTLADRLAEGGRGRSVLLTALVILALPAGSLLALPLAAMPQPITTALLAMGLIALLYLVTEELLAEAHEVAENSWVTATFFIGFLLLLILDEQIK
jgi:ZIP family zinc transporter